MFQELIDLAGKNPVLTAGIGTVAFGSVMYIIKGIPVWVGNTIRRRFTIQVDMNSHSVLYREVVEILSQNRVRFLERLFTTDLNGSIVAGYGTSIALWGRTPIVFTRELIEKNLRLDEKISVRLYTRNLKVLESLLEAARTPPVQNMIKVYQYAAACFGYPIKRKKR